MSASKLHTSRGMRQRLGRLSESMLGMLSGGGSKERIPLPAHGSVLLVSRIIVALFTASLALVCLNSFLHTLSFFSPPQKGEGTDSGIPVILQHQQQSILAVEDYPSVLVSESESFKVKGAATEKEDLQSSLVSPLSDDEVTHAPNFDSAEEPVARIIVITMDRDQSFRRLVNSLERANYGEDHVNLDIWIDRGKDIPIHDGVLQASRDITWKQGTKVIHKRTTNAGLYQQWIYTWNITSETTEFAIILEDDLEVSPAFYQWLRVARAAYAQDPDVGAFTLQRSTLRPRQVKGIATGPLKIPEEHHLFKYKLLGTWGFAPQRDQWVEFRKWFEEKRAKGDKPYVDGLMTTSWYKSQEVNGFAPTMWSQWWIKFVDERGYFTVTAHLPDGTTLASNWRESGLHYSKNKPSADFPIFRGNEEQFTMPDNPILVDWDGRIITPNVTTSS